MAVAKNPGIGQGRGGGRPHRVGPVKEVTLRLSPHAVELLRAAAEADNLPAWAVAERAILALQGEANAPPQAPPLPPEAQEIAAEVVVFLQAQEDRPAAVRVLRRAWKQSLALARHDLASEPIQKP